MPHHRLYQAVLRIRDPIPILDKILRNLRKYDLVFFVPDPDFFPSRILDPGVKIALDPDPDPHYWQQE
jgi:hypothetical protein